MLSSLVGISLRHRWIVLLLSILALGWGAYSARSAKYDVFPDFVPPQVTVQTEAAGFTPEQVEQLVTRPVEAIINGVGNMQSIRSESSQGLSVVTVVFRPDAEIMASRQMLAERLGELTGKLPAGVHAPTVSPLTSSTMDLLKVGLLPTEGGTGPDSTKLRAFSDRVVRPRLLSVPGVARCITFGGEVRELQITVDPAKALATGTTLGDVMTAVKARTGLGGAGFIDTHGQRIAVQAGNGTTEPAALSEISLTNTAGRQVRLRDVATVAYGNAPKFGTANIMGQPGVLLALSSQYGANTLEVTRSVEAALEELRPSADAAGIQMLGNLHRPASFVETSLANMRSSLLLGALLVTIVLLLFIGDFRVAFISLTAIPLSLLAAVGILHAFGVTLNTLTLGGLAIAIGEVVDDAIIDAENILRRLRENAKIAQPLPATTVVLSASIEVRGAVVYATFLVALVFLPVLTLSGIQGKFFGPLATSYILATLASLLVALVITPVLCLFLLTGSAARKSETTAQSKLKLGFARLARRVAQKPLWPAMGTVALCLGAYFCLPADNGQIMPTFREGHYVIQLSTGTGTSLDEMTRLGNRISQDLLALPEVATVEQQVGRAEQGEDTFGTNRCEFHVELKSGSDANTAGAGIRKVLADYKGIEAEVLTFLGDRISETITGELSPFVVNLFGQDLDVLDEKAAEVKAVLEGLHSATDIKIKSSDDEPRLQVAPFDGTITRLGLTRQTIDETLQASLQGVVVGQTPDGIQAIDVTVRNGSPPNSPEAIANLLIALPEGGAVRLSQLADVRLINGRSLISHDGARRRQVITCAAQDPSKLAEFSAEAEKAVRAKVTLPAGTYFEFGGDAKAAAEARQELFIHSAVALLGVIALLWLVSGSGRNAAIILLNLPFALAGGALSLALASLLGSVEGLSLGALVGFVTLFGISTRNSVMLMSHYQNLVASEGRLWDLETAVSGAVDRLTPILMTALVTGIGLLPLALGAAEAGREIEGPMAIVILGGLITSTFLNLFLLPAAALRWARFEAAKGVG